jgi:hypothetical protein
LWDPARSWLSDSYLDLAVYHDDDNSSHLELISSYTSCQHLFSESIGRVKLHILADSGADNLFGGQEVQEEISSRWLLLFIIVINGHASAIRLIM